MGCGSRVIGDSSNDPAVGEDEYEGINHPFNMFAYATQVRNFFGVTADDGKGGAGLVARTFPRYYRLEVTSPGNITFEACNSTTTTERPRCWERPPPTERSMARTTTY